MTTPMWEGTIELTVTTTFAYEVDADWGATDAEEARRQVETEVQDYLGPAFADGRFTETWVITRGTT